MKKAIYFLLILIYTFSAQAQKGGVCTLKGESNGKQVKLLWLMARWKAEFKGFEVKRRIVGGQWSTISSKFIQPEVSADKDLSNVMNDKSELERVTAKQKQLYATGKYKTILHDEYIQKLSKDTGAVIGMLMTFTMDYDNALMNGFAFIDAGMPQTDTYEYGVFLVSSDADNGKLLETWKWKYGQSTLMNFPVKVKTKPNRAKKAVTIQWEFTGKELHQSGYHGFNLYKKADNGELTKLNQGTIWKSGENKLSHFLVDESIDAQKNYNYILKSVSAFGTEGNAIEAKYIPANYMGESTPPVIDETGLKCQLNNVHIEWSFPNENMKFLKGFMVHRKSHIDSVYRVISSLIPADSRSYDDTKDLVFEKYYFYRVYAITTDVEQPKLESKDFLVFYKPVLKVNKPKGLAVKYIIEGGKRFMHLTWENQMTNLMKGYQIYASFPGKDYLTMQSDIKPVAGGSYKMEVLHFTGAEYKFAISAVSILGNESELSDTVKANSPTVIIPNVQIWPFEVDSNHIKVYWKYEKLADLKGFRLYQDGKLIVDESGLTASDRSWERNFEYNKKYKFEIEAVTKSGERSRISYPVVIATKAGKKKP